MSITPTRSSLRAGIAILLTATLLSGCAIGQKTTTAPEPASGPRQNINPQPPSNLRDGGALRIPIDAMPTNYNPIQINGARVITWQLSEALLPGAFFEGADGTYQLNTDYFDSAEISAGDTPVISYRIRKQATWSSGRALSWQDIASQAEALSAKNPAFEGYSDVGYNQIASVERGQDDNEALVTLSAPFAEWNSLFNLLLPLEVTGDPLTFNKGWLDAPQITAGPFVVDEIDDTAKSIVLKRNKDWWGQKPALESLVFRVLDPSARADELANGGIDLYPIGSDIDLYRRAQNIPGVEIRQASERLAGQITFNGSAGALLADRELRRAIARAIDPREITEVLLEEIVPGARPVGNHILPPSDPGYQDNSAVLSADLHEAEAALDLLGWVRDGETRAKDGRPLTLRYVGQATPAGETIAELLRTQLAEAGVQLEIQTVGLDSFYDGYLLAGNFDLIGFEWTKSASAFAHDRPVFQKPVGENFGSNFGRIYISEIDALYDEGLRTLDLEQRQNIANQIDVLAWSEAHHLPLYAGSGAYAVREGLANYGARGLGRYGFAEAGFMK